MSKKTFIFFASGLMIFFGFLIVQAAAPTFQLGAIIAPSQSVTFTGSPNRVINWTSYEGNAATANALAANPANCSAGYYPLGIAANGAVESCTLATTGALTGSGTANYMSKWTSASALGNSIVFDNGTNVGVGVTSPAQKLDVAGNVKTTGYIIVPSGIVPASTGAPDGKIFSPSGDYVSGTSWGVNYNEGAPDYIEFNNGTGPTSKIALDDGGAAFGLSGGNVGIGTAATTQKLTVSGNSAISGIEIISGGSSSNWASVNVGGAQSIQTAGSIYSYNSMCVGNNSGACNSTGGVVIGLANTSASVNIPSSGNIIFNNGGNVGIGKTNPTSKLDVVATGNTRAVNATSNDTNGTAVYGTALGTYGVGVYGQGNDDGVVGLGNVIGVAGVCVNAGCTGVYGQSADGYAGSFSGKGRFTSSVEATSFIYSSDRSLKKNIKTLDNSLGRILQLRGVSFDWKKDDKASIGLIAQEVEKVYPDLVSTNDEGAKSVQYGNLVAPLIEAIKEQQKKIDQLETRITILEINK